MGEEDQGRWPRSGVLLACVALLAAGYGAALLRGLAPAAEVSVVLAPVPATEEEPSVP